VFPIYASKKQIAAEICAEGRVPEARFVSLLIVAVALLLALARVLKLPHSLVLFAGGLVLSVIPGLPDARIEPKLVIGLFLPPMLYAATAVVSVHLVRHVLLPGLVAGAALVVAAAGAAALVAHMLLPDLDWAGAVLLGLVVSVSDTRALDESGHDKEVPRAVADVLQGQHIAVPLVLLSAFQLTSESLGGPVPEGETIAARFAKDWIGGLVVGVAAGLAVVWLRRRIRKAQIEIAMSVATPFLAAFLGSLLDLSVPAVVIVTALTVSAHVVDAKTGETISSPEARVTAKNLWREAKVILSGVLFLIVGYALPDAVGGIERFALPRLVATAAAVLAAVLAVQFIGALFALSLPPRGRIPSRDGASVPRLKAALVASWTSSRSAIGLVIALSIPYALPNGARFDDHDVILVLAAFVMIASIALQGLTTPLVMRWAGFGGESEREGEEALVRERLGTLDPTDPAAIAEARRALLALRRDNRIGDALLQEFIEEIDLRTRAAEIGATR
jgi:NhaP-type Na+/H+ or K+/H+ antiporter